MMATEDTVCVPESKTFILDFLKLEVHKVYQTPTNSTVTGKLKTKCVRRGW